MTTKRQKQIDKLRAKVKRSENRIWTKQQIINVFKNTEGHQLFNGGDFDTWFNNA